MKVKIRKEEPTYKITPLGLAAVALKIAGLVASIDDERIEVFWDEFENSMKRAGYIGE